MSLQGEQVLLRAYLESADRPPHTPSHERLIQAARKASLAGATVLRGILGVGSHGPIKRSPWSLFGQVHVPIIVEIVDSGERIMNFVEGPLLEIMIHGMVTLERANVMLYRDRRHDKQTDLALASLLTPLSTLPRIAERGRMKVDEKGLLLRVFVGESDRFGPQRLYEAIINEVGELGLAGATVLRGAEGFGAHSVVHRTSLLGMSSDRPIVIEIVDAEDQIKRFLPRLQEMVTEGLVTMEHVLIISYEQQTPAETA